MFIKIQKIKFKMNFNKYKNDQIINKSNVIINKSKSKQDKQISIIINDTNNDSLIDEHMEQEIKEIKEIESVINNTNKNSLFSQSYYDQYMCDEEEIQFINDGKDFFNGNCAYIRSPSHEFYWTYYNSDDYLRDVFIDKCKSQGIYNEEALFKFNIKRVTQAPIPFIEDMEKYCDEIIKEI
jgi:hypothetical protein